MEENEIALSVLQGNLDSYDWFGWIGSKDDKIELTWYWVDGTPMTFTNHKYNDSNWWTDSADCGTVHLKGRHKGQWDHGSCGALSKHPFLCKIPGVWLGLYEKNGKEGRWRWSDGTDYSFTNWAEGKPSDSGDCGMMHRSGWIDFFCEAEMQFMCEE